MIRPYPSDGRAVPSLLSDSLSNGQKGGSRIANRSLRLESRPEPDSKFPKSWSSDADVLS
jgi:hypothetical protein